MQHKLKKELIPIILILSLLTSAGTYVKEAEAALTFKTIPGDGDDAFGIECGDPDFVYVTVFNIGRLAKISKSNPNDIQLVPDDPDNVPVNAQKFYGIARDPNTGNLFISEKDNGKLWRFEPGTSTWTKKGLMQQPTDANGATNGLTLVSYPSGFDVRPNFVRFDNNADGDFDVGVDTELEINAGIFPGVVFANGNVWVGLDYETDFDFDANTAFNQGVANLNFKGLAKVNPSTMAVTLIDLKDAPSSAQSITGLVVDSADPKILWLTDKTGNKVFRFNTDTGIVTDTINLGANSNPLGIATDSTTVYVALNRPAGALANDNNEIARIDKSTKAIINPPLDTGVQNKAPGFAGTFSVFINSGLLVWTAQNNSTGIIDLSTTPPTVQPAKNTIDNTSRNHFGCVPVDGEFWFAGKGSARIGILPDSKFSVGRPVRPTGTGGSCDGRITITNDRRARGPCVIVDTTPPKIVRSFLTTNDYLCVETRDDTGTVKVSYNDKEIPRWAGSGNGAFCTNEELPPVIKVVAEDMAGNKSEKVVINTLQIITTGTEQRFTAVISKELNPHHGVEGILLASDSPIKQIRLMQSNDFSIRELRISDKGIKELHGEQLIKIDYKGSYGKEKKGQIYVFATNMGMLATFDVVVNDDIRLYPHQEKQKHGTYDLDLRSVSSLDEMKLNAWQKAELERVFNGKGELNIIQQNVLSKVLMLVEGL